MVAARDCMSGMSMLITVASVEVVVKASVIVVVAVMDMEIVMVWDMEMIEARRLSTILRLLIAKTCSYFIVNC